MHLPQGALALSVLDETLAFYRNPEDVKTLLQEIEQGYPTV